MEPVIFSVTKSVAQPRSTKVTVSCIQVEVNGVQCLTYMLLIRDYKLLFVSFHKFEHKPS